VAVVQDVLRTEKQKRVQQRRIIFERLAAQTQTGEPSSASAPTGTIQSAAANAPAVLAAGVDEMGPSSGLVEPPAYALPAMPTPPESQDTSAPPPSYSRRD
jgi:hypothetical protein